MRNIRRRVICNYDRCLKAHSSLPPILMAEVASLTLTNICLDVQIGICMFLEPSDILALLKVCRHRKCSLLKSVKYYCKALQPSTRQWVVWEAQLHRVCLDNTLFLPSFPISEMSDLEIGKAAMGPRRWIKLCNPSNQRMCPRATRIINGSVATKVDKWKFIFLVPGGRYLVASSYYNISILALGYTSSADYKLIASVGRDWRSFDSSGHPRWHGPDIFFVSTVSFVSPPLYI